MSTLSNELLSLIADFASAPSSTFSETALQKSSDGPSCTLKSLRLASKQFYDAVAPSIFFSTCRLPKRVCDIDELGDTRFPLLRTQRGSTHILDHHTRRLRLDVTMWDYLEIEGHASKNLIAVMTESLGLKNLQSLELRFSSVSCCYNGRLVSEILSLLKSAPTSVKIRIEVAVSVSPVDIGPFRDLPTIHELQVKWHPQMSLPDIRNSVSQAAQLLLHQSHMEVLELYLPWQWTSRHGTRLGNVLPRITQLIPEPLSLKELRIRDLTVTADDISRNVPHLRNLRALTMDRNKDSSGHCWAELQKAGIRLEDIRVDEINIPLRDYLESYSSLRRLQVGLLRPFEPADPSKQPERFFPRILVGHRNSLKELSLNVDAPVRPLGDYATNEQFKKALASCLELRVLKVRITITDEELAENNATSFEQWLDTATLIPALQHLHLDFFVSGTGTGIPELIKCKDLLKRAIIMFRENRTPHFIIREGVDEMRMPRWRFNGGDAF